MAQQPAAPTLSAAPRPQAVRIDFAVPTDGEIHAAVHLHEAGGARRMYDAATGTILPAGEAGQVIVFTAGVAGRNFIVVAKGLGGGTFTATVCFRRAYDFDWGPTSPRSAPLVRALPPAPGAPMLEAVSDKEIGVHFAVPQGCSMASIIFYEDGATRRFVDKTTHTLTAQGTTELVFPVTGDKSILVKGLSSEISYTVEVSAHNGIGWSPRSPASKPLKLADHQPPAPGAPVLERVSADSVRVFCRLSPECTHADIFFKAVTTGVELSVDEQSGNKLREPGEGFAPTRDDCYKGVVVLGVSPDTEYEVLCKQCSDFGWSDASPSTMLPAASRPAAPPAQPAIQAPVVPTWPAPAPAPPHARLPPESGVVPTGGGVPVASAVPPRPNCRKRAVDADDTDDDAPPPASRPIKQEKRKNAHGYDCTDGFCVADGDEDEPARGEPVEPVLPYLDQVKAEFRDEPETYNEFLEIVKSFRSQQIDMPALIRRVSTLFVGHGKLIDGFSTFLPKAYGGIEGTDDVLPPASRLRARTSTEDIFGEPDSDEGDQDDAAEKPAKRRKESPRWDTVSM